jgi:hypothetical protein
MAADTCGVKYMDPRVLNFLSDTNGMSPHEVELNDTLMKMYIGGLIEARWNGTEPLFSVSIAGREEYALMYAQEQSVIEE